MYVDWWVHGKIIYVDNLYEDVWLANDDAEIGKCEVKKWKVEIWGYSFSESVHLGETLG